MSIASLSNGEPVSAPLRGQAADDADRSQPSATGLPSGATVGAFDWKGALGEGYAQHEKLLAAKGWKGPADVLASYSGLESMIGTEKIPLPGKDAGPEAWEAVWKKLGRPEKPEGYVLQRPADLALYSDDFAQRFRQAAHQGGLNARQAAALHDWWVQEVGQGLKAESEQGQLAEGELRRKLEIAWGSQRDEKLESARRAARHFGLAEAQLAKLEALTGDFRLIEALSGIGGLLGEDRLVGRQTSMLTQEAARGELRRLEGDAEFRRAYIDRGHPGHDEAVRRMTELAERANPFAVARAGR